MVKLVLIWILATFFISSVQAAEVDCSVEMTNIPFDAINFVTGGNGFSSSGTLTINCINQTPEVQMVKMCVYAGDSGGNNSLYLTSTSGIQLPFSLWYQNQNPWQGDQYPIMLGFDITAQGEHIESIPIQAIISGKQLTMPAGHYVTTFLSGTNAQWSNSAILAPPSCTYQPVQQSFSFMVDATVTPGCNISAADINFGSQYLYDRSDVEAQGLIRLECTPNTDVSVVLSSPNVQENTFQMLGGDSGNIKSMPYFIYKDIGHTDLWLPNATLNTNSGSNVSYVINLYGKLPSSSLVVGPGNYQDTIQISVTY